MDKKFIILILFFSCMSFGYAANCGGNVTCECGDGVVPISDMEYLNRTLASSSLIVVPEANHGELTTNEDILKKINEVLK